MKTAFRNVALATAAFSLVPLAACTEVDDDPADVTPEEVSNRTLAATLTGAPGMETISSAISDAGLSSVFDGPGSYTVFAPDDDAFGTLGDERQALMSEDQRPVLVAILRDHIVPGHLTPEAIGKAIDEQGGKVEMRTVGDGTITFTRDGENFTLTGQDGSTAHIDGAALAASNGVAIPLDGLLKKVEPTS